MIAGAIAQEQDDNNNNLAQIYERALQDAKEKQIALQKGHFMKRMGANVKRGIRLIMRALKLFVTLTPVVALYPISQLLVSRQPRDPTQTTRDIALSSFDNEEEPPILLGWYLRLCLQCVEASGAAVIKLMQWAGSRPDMFGHDFCAVFSKLQDDTTPHAWRHTELVLQEAYGEDWKEHITINKDDILGSGCIGYVLFQINA